MDKWVNLGPVKILQRRERIHITPTASKTGKLSRLAYTENPLFSDLARKKEIDNISSFQFFVVHLKRKHIAYYSIH